jgi:hypothetical protein
MSSSPTAPSSSKTTATASRSLHLPLSSAMVSRSSTLSARRGSSTPPRTSKSTNSYSPRFAHSPPVSNMHYTASLNAWFDGTIGWTRRSRRLLVNRSRSLSSSGLSRSDVWGGRSAGNRTRRRRRSCLLLKRSI